MVRLGWPLTFLWYGQICVPVAVAILEDCRMAFTNMQVSELWPMGLLFSENRRCFTIMELIIYKECKAFFSRKIWDNTVNSALRTTWGWLGVAKVLCILCHWVIQLILAYSWARPAFLVAGKGGGGVFLFLLFLHFHSCSLSSLSLSFISSTISFISFSGRWRKMTHKGWRVIKPQHKEIKNHLF